MLNGVVVTARPVEELSSAQDGSVGQVEPEFGSQLALRTDPIFGTNFWRIFELKKIVKSIVK